MEPVSDPRIYSNRYQVTHLIDRGGMAMVYRAQDLLLSRAVALKILYPELSADPLFVERFRREAQAAANLSHPNIVPVFDWGEDAGTYFIVMELIDGTSLVEMLRGGRTLTPSRSAQIVAQVAAALGYAHRSGVVHRDVKPGNILINSDGQVKVTDFGIAQAMASEDHLAEAGSVMGTATYFSPEQAEGVAVDGRSDVYSLGVVLYEMLVGRPPFVGDTPLEVSSQHVHGSVPPLSKFNDTVPYDLEAIVMEALAKSPDHRYQTADEMRADLLRFTEGQPVRASAREVAFFGADATRAVSTVTAGERTQSVPIMSGPRTDIRRRNNATGWLSAALIVVIAVGGLAYFLFNGTNANTLTMPYVIGQSVGPATTQLKTAGLEVKTISQHSKQPIDQVLSTNPKAGSPVKKHDVVTLTISSGVVKTPVTVPDTTGMSLSDAESALSTAHLVPYVNQVPTAPAGVTARPGVVLAQSPAATTSAFSGDKVTLTVLASNALYPVPSLQGQTPLQAASVLGEYGLNVGPTGAPMCSNSVSSGLVLKTIPAAGTLVSGGKSVEIIASSGFCQVVVVSVIGDTPSAADTALKADHLFLGQETQADPSLCTDPTLSGTIVTQTPQAGGMAVYSSTVAVTVCP